MDKKLPGIFVNPAQKSSGNNERVSYSSKEERLPEETTKSSKVVLNEKNVNQKINDIFNSSNYVYKADVEIKLKDKTITARIVGRNSTHLITIENELIPISDVTDIKRIEK